MLRHTELRALGHAPEQVVNNPHASRGTRGVCGGAENPTTVVRVLGCRTRSRAFGTRRRATVHRWCTGRRRTAPRAPAGTSRRARRSARAPGSRARTPHHARAECGGQRRWAPRGGLHAPAATKAPAPRRDAVPARRDGEGGINQRKVCRLPHEPLFSIGGGEVDTNFPTRPLFSIVVGKLEFGKGCNQRTFSNFPTSHSSV